MSLDGHTGSRLQFRERARAECSKRDRGLLCTYQNHVANLHSCDTNVFPSKRSSPNIAKNPTWSWSVDRHMCKPHVSQSSGPIFFVRTRLFQNVAPIFCFCASTHRDAHEHKPKHSQTHANTDPRPCVHSHMHTLILSLFFNFIVSFIFSTVCLFCTYRHNHTHTHI